MKKNRMGKITAKGILTMPRYSKPLLEQCLNLPAISLTDLIYHYILAMLLRHDNNRTSLAKAIRVPLRTLRNRLHEIDAAGYPVPERIHGYIHWKKREREDYENRSGINCAKRGA